MSTYVSSQFAMKTGQGRHRRRRDLALRMFTTLAAFMVAAVALSGAMVLLQQAGLTLVTQAPGTALAFLSGASFVMMVLVAGSRADRG